MQPRTEPRASRGERITGALVATLLLAGSAIPVPASAETFDTCAGFIDQLPAVIDQQGVWCLRKDLATAVASGAAISVAVNNVTIDCNGYKIGGLAAGAASTTSGIHAYSRSNITIRGCNLRGFNFGVALDGSGHLVEDNRLDGNLHAAIYITGSDNLVRRNTITDTGGHAQGFDAYGIFAAADLVENRIDGVFSDGADHGAIGIIATAPGSVVRGNTVRGLVPGPGGLGSGLVVVQGGVRIDSNHLIGQAGSANGIAGPGLHTFCLHNSVRGFSTPSVGCTTSTGNAY